HTLVALGCLRALAHGAERPGAARLRRILERNQRPEVLHLATLFHDIAKGCGGQHAERGVPVVRSAAERLGFSEEEAELAARVVGRHLDMSGFSQRRNLEDPAEIARFATIVGDLETLE